MTTHSTRRGRGRQLLRAALTALAVGGLLGAAALGGSPVARAATTDSAVTVKWAGGNPGDVQKYQPDHAATTSDGHGSDNGSGHWSDFKDLSVTVSKTSGLSDEAIDVTASGMAPLSMTNEIHASNFLQVMQCWGPDPLAADFAETCQYGGWYGGDGDNASAAAMSKQVGFDVASRNNSVAFSALANSGPSKSWMDDPTPDHPTSYVPFRAVTGKKNQPSRYDASSNPAFPNYVNTFGLNAFFDASSSNEQDFVPVGSDGTARGAFQVQTAVTQPYLGCGAAAPQGAGGRCWLVIVPRGTHYGALAPGKPCMPALTGVDWGSVLPDGQMGSPLSRECSYWQDRVVVPLDFQDVKPTCGTGAEVRLAGTELLGTAMSSWQRGLCGAVGAPVSMATNNSPDLMRSQLLTGQSTFAVVNRPLTAGNIGVADPSLLSTAKVAYAPLANTGLAIGYVATSRAGAKFDDYRNLKLTPRLLAKLLTQSYVADIPYSNGSWSLSSPLWRAGRPISLKEDPEWLALGNPSFSAAGGVLQVFVPVGPQADDALRLMWQYVQSDADAAAFLRGEADPWGMTVNPSYLPTGNPGRAGDGAPVDLSKEPVDTIPRLDPTVLESQGKTINSTSFVPYSTTFADNANRIFHADPRTTNVYDTEVFVGGKKEGAWVKAAAQLIGTGGQLTMGPVTAGDAERNKLATMQLAEPLQARTGKDDVASVRTFVAPTAESMAAAVPAMVTDPATGTAAVDPAKLPKDAYPLTMTLYGTVDLASSGLDTTNRAQYAGLLDYTAGAGNVPGEGPGQLPAGYTPLTAAQIAQSKKVAGWLRNPATVPKDGPGASTGGGPGGGNVSAGGPGGGAAGPGASTGGDSPSTSNSLPDASTQMAATAGPDGSATGALGGSGQVAVGATLLGGVASLIGTPFLLRRRIMGG